MPKNDDISVKLSGLPGCDSCRRARRWFEARGVRVGFRDLRDAPPSITELGDWADAVGWDTLVNRRSTTWRGLPPAQREGLDRIRGLALLAAHPTLIKRPVVESARGVSVGTDEAAWAGLVGS